jgi:hypothetical protein
MLRHIVTLVASLAAALACPTVLLAQAVPDIEGLWSYRADTPLQREAHLGEQQAWTQADLAGLEDADWRSGAAVATSPEDHHGFGSLSLARVNGEYRTSLIIAPANGRIPYLPDSRSRGRIGTADGPEDFTARQRCLAPSAQLPLLAPTPDQTQAQRSLRIVQTPDYLLIQQPGSNHARIIKLNGRPLPYQGAQWLGDSQGLFDAESLVVNTSDFRPEQGNAVIPSSRALQIYERFTLLDDGQLLYTYTVFDPRRFAEPFTVEMPLSRLPDNTRFSAEHCHESNLSLPASLIRQRLQEAVKNRWAGTN